MQASKDCKQNKYFRLMEVIGTEGRYQNILILLFSLLMLQVGCISLGNPYYFAVAPYVNCPQPYTTASQCNKYVCSLPEDQRYQYLQHEISQLRTLGNQFGDFHCDRSDIISTAMGMFFLGSIFGYLFIGSIVDNFGRKLSFNLCLVLGLFGQFLVMISPNLPLAEVGLFLMGFGLQNCLNLCFYFLSQEFSDKKRQIGGVVTQSCFCIGGLSTILWFYWMKNWKIIFWICYFIPLCILTVISLIYLKETPQFLIRRHPVQAIRKELLFIARLNNREAQFQSSQFTTIQALQSLKDQYASLSQTSNKQFFSFADLFRYKSLRKMTLLLGAVCFATDFLYYAPLMLIDQFGFNFYMNGVLINISELITYAVTFIYITRIERKKLALYLFLAAFICSFALVFLHSDAICQQDCWNAQEVFELIFVILLRFVVSLEFQVLLIYAIELYPTQIAGVGMSYISIVGTLPNIFIPELINICNRFGINIMIFFCFVSLLGFAPSKFLRETKGTAIIDQIEEFGVKEEGQKAQVELIEELS